MPATVQSKDVKECAFYMCQPSAVVESVSVGPGPKFITFSFSELDSSALDTLRRTYFSRKAIVEPMVFAEALESVRTLQKNPTAVR